MIVFLALCCIAIPVSAASELCVPKDQGNPSSCVESNNDLRFMITDHVNSVCAVHIRLDVDTNDIQLFSVTLKVNLDKVNGRTKLFTRVKKRRHLHGVPCVLRSSTFALDSPSTHSIYRKAVTIWFRRPIRLKWTDKDGSTCITFPTSQIRNVSLRISKDAKEAKSSDERNPTLTRKKRSVSATTTRTSPGSENPPCSSLDSILYRVALALGFFSFALVCFAVCRGLQETNPPLTNHRRQGTWMFFSHHAPKKSDDRPTSLEGNVGSINSKEEDTNSFFEIVAVYDTLHDAPVDSDSTAPCLNHEDESDTTPTEFLENVTDDATSTVHNENLDNLTSHLQGLNRSQGSVNSDKENGEAYNPDDFFMEMQDLRAFSENLAMYDSANQDCDNQDMGDSNIGNNNQENN